MIQNNGMHYTHILRNMHLWLEPENYFEIGTLHGNTLSLAKCAAIAVDPRFDLRVSATEARHFTGFYQIPSDVFFRKYSPTAIFSREIALAFLDGLHWFEFLLRDFINTEKHCAVNSVIAMHDCVPMDIGMAAKLENHASSQQWPGYWTGDVWKIVPTLRQYRPDLAFYCFDAAATGLCFATNLDPKSTVLEKNYNKIIAEWRKITLEDYGIERLEGDLQLISSSALDDRSRMGEYFWL